MLIIWGFRMVWRTLSEGVFHCPDEDRDVPYRVSSGRRFLTVFWIPLIPLKKVGEAVQCGSCHTRFPVSVLSTPTSSQLGERLADAALAGVLALLRVDGLAPTTATRTEAVRVLRALADTGYDDAQLTRDLTAHAPADVTSAVSAAGAFLSMTGRERVLSECVRVAVADGPASVAERDVITRIGAALGMSAAHVHGVVSSTEAETNGRP